MITNINFTFNNIIFKFIETRNFEKLMRVGLEKLMDVIVRFPELISGCWTISN